VAGLTAPLRQAAEPAPPRAADEAARGIGLFTALSVLVSNMIGTGVFTSLGFQVAGTHTGFALLALWAVGGVVALCGSLAYAELGTALPRSGGEYVYLGRIYHPLVGFLGGWVSMTVGFAAPIALAGIAFGRYLGALVALPPLAGSLVVLAIVVTIHVSDLRLARRFQVAVTTLELVLITGFVVAGLRYPRPEPISFAPTTAALGEMVAPSFAVSLIYVSYAFSGWNAAGYVAGEISRPQQVIPRALAAGTAVVTLFYLLLNWTFLRTVSLGDLAGTVEVGALSATRMFGPVGGALMSAVIAALLVATISAMVLAGSRVTQAVFADLPTLDVLGKRAENGVPRNAILVQLALILGLLLSGSFERVMAYAGFTLNLMTLLTVTGLYLLRRREPDLARPYLVWGYPVTPLIFVLVSLWTLGFVLAERPLESVAGLGTLVLGTAIYLAAHRAGRRQRRGR
jgi:APA family basic amino acid/polyamine antiporter